MHLFFVVIFKYIFKNSNAEAIGNHKLSMNSIRTKTRIDRKKRKGIFSVHTLFWMYRECKQSCTQCFTIQRYCPVSIQLQFCDCVEEECPKIGFSASCDVCHVNCGLMQKCMQHFMFVWRRSSLGHWSASYDLCVSLDTHRLLMLCFIFVWRRSSCRHRSASYCVFVSLDAHHALMPKLIQSITYHLTG